MESFQALVMTTKFIQEKILKTQKHTKKTKLAETVLKHNIHSLHQN